MAVPNRRTSADGDAVAGFGRPGTRLGYQPALEGLRGVAVIFVLAVHLGQFVDTSVGDWLLPGGFVGVDMFFVLSGFLIGAILFAELESTETIAVWSFYGRRFMRLAPALALFLAAHFVYSAVIGASLAEERHIAIWSGLFIANWLNSVGQGALNDMVHLWSVAVEAQFYLVIPLVLFLLHRFVRSTERIVGILVAVAAVVAVVRFFQYEAWGDWITVYERTDARADTFLFGVIVAVLWCRGGLRRRPAVLAGSIGAVVVVAIGFAARANPGSPFLFQWGFTVFAAATAAVIAGCLWPGSTVGRVLAVRPLRLVGLISYSLYLWHLPVYLWVAEHVDAPGLVKMTLAVVLSFALAVPAFLIAERPVLLRRRRSALRLRAATHDAVGPVDAQVPAPG